MLLATILLAVAPAASVGPPTLCHPFDIGDARSLPWGKGAFATLPSYDISKLPQDTYDILMRSDDPIVHAETLRRAALYATGAFGDREAPSMQQREELLAALFQELEFDTDVHKLAGKAACEKAAGAKCAKDAPSTAPLHWLPALDPAWGGRVCQAQARDPALCFLDVGYLRAALREAGAPRHDDGIQTLRTAMLLKPDDLALALTASLGLLDNPDAATRQEAWRILDSVAQRTEDAPAREKLEKNLLAAVGPILNAKDHDQLIQRLHERAEQG